MSTPAICPRCQTPLPTTSLLSVCHACALDAALEDIPVPTPNIPGVNIERLAAEGGMGLIFKGTQIAAGNRPVAIKVLKGEGFSERSRVRFRREADLLGRLHHPSIAAIYDAGTTEEGTFYLLMEWIDGWPVTEWWLKRKATDREIVESVLQIADAVQAAHAVNIIHRDLKPSNILGTNTGVLKVLDFGLARDDEDTRQLSQTGSVLGTAGFMALEQGKGQPAGPPADVFALGALLFLGLTGRHPFPTGSLYENLASQEARLPLSFTDPAPAKDLQAIIRKSLRAEPERRYRNAGEFAEDLRNYLQNRPVNAQPDSASYRFNKFILRNRTLTASIVALGIGTAAAIGIYVQGKQQAALAQRSQLAETLLVSAELSAQRGQLGASLALLSQAKTLNSLQQGRIILAELAALDGLGQKKEAKDVLDKFQATLEADVSISRGMADYWRAQLCHGADQLPDALRWLRSALEKGLPPAEKAISQALLSEDDGESEKILTAAANELPFHPKITELRCFALVAARKFEEARAATETNVRLFPQNPHIRTNALLIAAHSGLAPGSAIQLSEEDNANIDKAGLALGQLPKLYDMLWRPPPAGLESVMAQLLGKKAEKAIPEQTPLVNESSSLAWHFIYRGRKRELDTVLPIAQMDADPAIKALREELKRMTPSPLIAAALLTRIDVNRYWDDPALRAEMEEQCNDILHRCLLNDQERAVILEIAAAVTCNEGYRANNDAAGNRSVDFIRQRAAITSVPPAEGPMSLMCNICLRWPGWDAAQVLIPQFYAQTPRPRQAILNMAQLYAHDNSWNKCLETLAQFKAENEGEIKLATNLRESAVAGVKAALDASKALPPEVP